MKILYIDCQMGAAGDMLLAALLDLFEDKDALLKKMNQLQIPGLSVSCEKVAREEISGTQIHIRVEEPERLKGRTLRDVQYIIDALQVSNAVKKDAKGVFQIIAEAEAIIHETDLDHVHFHEVGSLSAIADIVGTCLLMEELAVDQVVVSPIHVGHGTVRCVHGILPVPAPATAKILGNMPFYSGNVQGELCTPTGAALLKYFADAFGTTPKMTVEKKGRGMGTKIFPGQINGIGVLLGYCEI